MTTENAANAATTNPTTNNPASVASPPAARDSGKMTKEQKEAAHAAKVAALHPFLAACANGLPPLLAVNAALDACPAGTHTTSEAMADAIAARFGLPASKATAFLTVALLDRPDWTSARRFGLARVDRATYEAERAERENAEDKRDKAIAFLGTLPADMTIGAFLADSAKVEAFRAALANAPRTPKDKGTTDPPAAPSPEASAPASPAAPEGASAAPVPSPSPEPAPEPAKGKGKDRRSGPSGKVK